MTYLDHILAAHRERAAADDRSFESLLDEARLTDVPRGFAHAITSQPGLAVIAEIKRRSPSKGDLFANLDPTVLAAGYAKGGAACLSVLTDEVFFGGSQADLRAAHAASGLPVLRKDFTVSAHDVCDARIMGADAVLLIVAALDDVELEDFYALSRELGMDVLVETHDEHEVDRALNVGARVIGVNQRDLVTFRVDTDRAVRVVGAIPESVVRVAESGINGPASARVLADAGFDAVLVGETLVTSTDPGAMVAALRNG